jgi:hypothetical protein
MYFRVEDQTLGRNSSYNLIKMCMCVYMDDELLFCIWFSLLLLRFLILGLCPFWRTDTANQRGGSEWEPIKILLEGDGNSDKMNKASNTRLRLTTQVVQAHVATGVPLDLGTNTQPSDPRTQRNVIELPKIIPYYRLSRSTWPLSNNKELLSRFRRVRPGKSHTTGSLICAKPTRRRDQSTTLHYIKVHKFNIITNQVFCTWK